MLVDGVFKVPVSAAPRTTQASPITVNNIAQRLSPHALMEHISQANVSSCQLARVLIAQAMIRQRPWVIMLHACGVFNAG